MPARRSPYLLRARLLTPLLWFFLAGCSLDAPVDPPTGPGRRPQGVQAEQRAFALPDRLDLTLPWGPGPAEVRFSPPGLEQVAAGPSAIAVTPDGAALVLDRLGGRVLRVTGPGGVAELAKVPRDAEDLGVGPGGDIVVFSPLRATAWLFGADGRASGELGVPRVLREIQGISLGVSRRVLLRTAYQEQLVLGSPAAPLSLAAALRTKAEGAFAIGNGRTVAARVDGEAAAIVVLEPGPAEDPRAREVQRHRLPGEASAVRLVGAAGSLVCARIERVRSSPEIEVERRAVCLDAGTGDVLAELALPPPGSYVPRTELAVGGAEPRLAWLHPAADGLRLTSVQLHREQGSAEVSP